MRRDDLLTEQRLADSVHLDTMSVEEAVALMQRQDELAVAAVGAQGGAIAAGVRLIASAFARGGRLFYVGAGTSGRLGVLDASECPPTFRSSPEQVQGIIAGGREAVFAAKEGAEDDAGAGAREMDGRRVSENDVVCGIAAGGTTPFVHGALRRARELGAGTIFVACVGPTAGEAEVDVAIRPLTGPEVLTGSTRLKAGTATKLVLNRLSTLAMVRVGKCYENLMVDLRASNAKLVDRAVRIVRLVTGADDPQARASLDRADGHVKLAIVMHQRGMTAPAARDCLERVGGSLRRALGSAPVEDHGGKGG